MPENKKPENKKKLVPVPAPEAPVPPPEPPQPFKKKKGAGIESAEAAIRALQADAKAREERCREKLSAILQEENCSIVGQMVLRPGQAPELVWGIQANPAKS